MRAPRLAFVMLVALAIANCGPGSTDSTQTSRLDQAANSSIQPTTKRPKPVPESVGILGCSMTVDAVQGYHAMGGTLLWPPRKLGYGGGTVARWANPDRWPTLWEGFDRGLSAHPDTTSVWWQLCTSDTRMDNLENAQQVFRLLRERLPQASVFVSAQPTYVGGHVCESAGPAGPTRMADLVQQLISDDTTLRRGPELSELSPSDLTDTCHANVDGRSQMGMELVDFLRSGESG